MLYIKEEGTFAKFKCDTCNDQTIRYIKHFHIVVLEFGSKIFK